MSDSELGIIVFLIGLAAIIAFVVRSSTSKGMAIVSAMLFMAGIFIFVPAKSSIQEITGSIFLVGSAISLALAGLSRDIKGPPDRKISSSRIEPPSL